MLQDLGWFELSTAAKAFIIVHTLLVILAIAAGLAFVISDDPWLRRLLNRRRLRKLPKLKAGAEASSGNPILCSMPRCRNCGEIFWQTRQGTVMLCRDHAVKVRNHLDQFLKAAR